MVLDIDPKAKRIALGMKQIEPNPWTLLEDKYPIGSVIKGQVRNVTDFGVFVGVEEGIDGLVHVSDISWTQRIKHPGEIYKKGDEVEAVVLNIDVENERFSSGIKQLAAGSVGHAQRAHAGGHAASRARSPRSPTSAPSWRSSRASKAWCTSPSCKEERVENPRDVVKEGEEVEVKVIDINTQDRKVALSMKALAPRGRRRLPRVPAQAGRRQPRPPGRRHGQ